MASADLDQIISDEDVEFFRANGYLVGPKILTDQDLNVVPRELERVFAGERDFSNWGWLHDLDGGPPTNPSATLKEHANAWWVNRVIRERVTMSPVLGAFAARLMGANTVRVWHDQLFWKAGAKPDQPFASNVGWHQDGAYWRMCSREPVMLTGWVAFRETTVDNGCVQVIQGSNQWGLMEESALFEVQDLEENRRRQERAGLPWIEVPMPLLPGHVSFHHSRTLHGSGPNRTPHPRLGMAVSMMPGDNSYVASTQWHNNVTLLGPNALDGTPFTGDFWPQIWP
jgi:hypothetical protein